MHIATICIGDFLVTLTKHIPLDRNEDDPEAYNLAFTDLATGTSYTKSIIGENPAMLALAAWIVVDQSEAVRDGADMLWNDPAMKPFLP